MKTRSFFLLMFSLCAFTATAQHQLSGTVKDGADGAPVPYATAALLRPDSSAITGVVTGDDGRFVLANVAAGDYLLQISFIGYEKAYRKVSVPAQSGLGEISLSESATRMDEVVITGRRALVEQRLDRMVVNVSGNIITSGLNVQDLLKQLPGLVVDQDGNVKLNGRPATVYIDGRPTRLPAEQVAQMLNGMMGDVVDRVELIDNPSSRYEAGMSAAIVNIRMKRDASLGLNGTASLSGGFTEHDDAWRGGLNLNYRSKGLNIFGNYGYNNAPQYMDLYQMRHYGGDVPVTYDQHALQQGTSVNHSLRTGIDWFVSPKQTIGFLFTGAYNNRDENGAAEAMITRTGASKIDSTELSDTWVNSKFSSQMYNLNYRLAGDKGEELTVDADYGRIYAKIWQNMQSRYYNSDGSERLLPSEFQYSGPRNIDIFSLKADYEKPISEKSKIEAGAKTGKTITDNEILYEDLYDGKWEINRNQSNRFKYTEVVSAGYVTYSHQFGKLSAMAGLRAEHTSIKGESPTMDTTFTHKYLGWFPSAYLQYQINDKQGLNLSYSRKINRPGYNSLNPFREYLDPFTFGSGNPDLQPEYRNTVALRYNIGEYMASASYSAVNDVLEKEFMQDDVSKITSIIQKNIGKRQRLNLTSFVPIKFAKWYTVNIYAEVAYFMVDARYNGEPFNDDYWGAYADMQHAFTILPTLRANVQMMWMSPSRTGLIARLDGMWSMGAQVEKSFFDRRLSLSLSCNDIFGSLVYTGKLKSGNINQAIKEDHSIRQVMLTARYSFGSQKIRGARNRSVGIEEEMGRAR